MCAGESISTRERRACAFILPGSRSRAFAAAFTAEKALVNVNVNVNAERTFTFTPTMVCVLSAGFNSQSNPTTGRARAHGAALLFWCPSRLLRQFQIVARVILE